jgi:hypothetical protein
VAPGITDALVGVQDHERPVALGQVIAHRQTSLATTDDHGLDGLRSGGGRSPGRFGIAVSVHGGSSADGWTPSLASGIAWENSQSGS